MIRKCDVIKLFVSLASVVCCIDVCHGRNMTQCEFIDQFRKYSPQISHDDLNKWTCIVQFTSNFSTKRNVDADGTSSYGLFQLNDRYLCKRKAGDQRICNIPCTKFEDDYYGDDFQCVRKIYATHLGLFGSGFSAWPIYNVNCTEPRDYVNECADRMASANNKDTLTRFGNEIDVEERPAETKIYERCELARELYTVHKFPMEQIHTWVCIVENESRYNTSAIGALNADGSRNHGLFQISETFWCTKNDTPKACGIPCSKLEDADITDDIECMRKIFDEHQRLFGNGFHAWVVYEPQCRRSQTELYVRDCFETEALVEPPKIDSVRPQQKGKTYERCELAKELRDRHHVPDEQIADWVCIAEQQSNLMTSARGQREHGLFRISDQFWCSLGAHDDINGCQLDCAKLEDTDISDDVACARKIHAEHQKNSGNGFTAWASYEANCYGRSAKLVENCFDETKVFTPKTAKSNEIILQPTQVTPRPENFGKIYGRCELAKELYLTYDFPLDQIPTWICIVEHESKYNTSAVGRLNADGSRDHGLFQLSDRWWCSNDTSVTKSCGVLCSQFEDADIRDDVECTKKIFDEHQRLHQNGFNAWVVYEEQCKHQTVGYIQGCFDDEADMPKSVTKTTAPPLTAVTTPAYPAIPPIREGKTYTRCELANELRDVHNVPQDQIADWVCIASFHSNFKTSTRGATTYGLFQIGGDWWCSEGKACNVDCAKLIDDDITDDITCARKIHAKHGFPAWAAFEPNCRGRSSEFVRNCFTDERNSPIPVSNDIQVTKLASSPPAPPTASASISPIHLEHSAPLPAPSLAPHPKIPSTSEPETTTKRCDPNKGSGYVQNFAFDQTRQWVCVVQQKSRLIPMGNDFHASKAFDFFCKFHAPDASSDCVNDEEGFAHVTRNLIAGTDGQIPRQKKQVPLSSTTRPNRNRFNTYKIPSFEQSTNPLTSEMTTTPTPVRMNDFYRNFVDAQRSKLIDASTISEELFAQLNSFNA